jgi:hypothetical protein
MSQLEGGGCPMYRKCWLLGQRNQKIFFFTIGPVVYFFNIGLVATVIRLGYEQDFDALHESKKIAKTFIQFLFKNHPKFI